MLSRVPVLRHAAFRRVWLSQSLSVLGDRIVLAALPLFVTDLTGSATDVGLVLGAQALPLVVFLLAGGIWADRLPRARLAAATDLVRFAVQAVVAVLILTHEVQVWQLVVSGLVFGAAEAFAQPAMTGLLPQTVEEDEFQEAHAVIQTSTSAAGLLGPAIGTALVVGLGAGVAFAVDAGTFVVSALLLYGVTARTRRSADPDAATEHPSWRRELAAGFAEVRTRPWVWITILSGTAFLLLSFAPLFVLGPTVAKEEYGSTAFFGVILVVFGAGSLIGGVVGLRWRPRHPMPLAFVLFTFWSLVGVALSLGAPRAVVGLLALAGGLSVALFEVWWSTLLAQEIPPEALSRVSSFDWMGSLALLPVGFALAGPAGELFGDGTVLVAGGLLTVIVTLAAGLIPRSMRQLRLAAPPQARSNARTAS
jgi:MFS family permease